MSPVDHDRLNEALALAAGAIGLSDPNPRVGCLIVSRDGEAVIGRGHTQRAGGAHAEAAALADAAGRGLSTAGATVYVTLEPCAHHGRTPPCANALVEAGVARVVSLSADPNPLVAGRGFRWLREAGIAVELPSPADPAARSLELEARELNIGFFSRMERGRPWVRMKIAASLDGRTALENGASRWITGEAARRDGHAWRRRAGAVLTGTGTVREDDPRLDVRLVETVRQPLRVVVDSRLEVRPRAALFDATGGVLLYAADAGVDPGRRAALEARGAEVAVAGGANGRVDLPAMLADLARRGINELHVEAGRRLNGSLLREGLVDELLVYLAPTMLGLGREMATFGPLSSLAEGAAFEFIDATRVDGDLRLRTRIRSKAAGESRT